MRSTDPTAPVRRAADLNHHPSLKDTAADHIRACIVSGEFAPGEKVDQEQIAARLGMSRLPVREALIELAATGYVDAVPRRGAYVVRLSAEDILDHFEVLGALFSLTSRRAAEVVDDAQLARLREIDAQILATDDPEARSTLHIEFYRVVNRLSSSARLLSALAYFAMALPNDYYRLASGRGEIESTYRTRLLDALAAHDPDAAARHSEEHLHECGRLTVEALEARGYWDEGDAATTEVSARPAE